MLPRPIVLLDSRQFWEKEAQLEHSCYYSFLPVFLFFLRVRFPVAWLIRLLHSNTLLNFNRQSNLRNEKKKKTRKNNIRQWCGLGHLGWNLRWRSKAEFWNKTTLGNLKRSPNLHQVFCSLPFCSRTEKISVANQKYLILISETDEHLVLATRELDL